MPTELLCHVFCGLATAGRFLPEVANVIGPFYSNLPVRFRLPEDDEVRMLLSHVRDRVAASSEFQDISQDRLRALGGKSDRPADAPLYQVTYSYQEARSRDLSFGDLVLEQVSVSRPDIENDVDFWVRNTRTGLIASVDFRGSIAESTVIECLRDDFLAALDALAGGGLAEVDWQCAGRLAGKGTTPGGAKEKASPRLFGRLMQGKS